MLIASSAVAVVFIAFALIILRGGLQNGLNKSGFMFIAGFAVWISLNYLSNIPTIGLAPQLIINRILFVVSLLEIYLIVNFAISVTRRDKSSIIFKLTTLLTYIVAFVAATPLVVESILISTTKPISIAIVFGRMASVYFIAIVLLVLYVMIELSVGSLDATSKRVRSSSRTLLLTIGFASIAILTTNVILPVVFNIFSASTPGLLFGAFAIAGVGYSVSRHGLFDIRLAVVRSVTYTLVLITLAGVYLGMAFAFSAVFSSNLFSPTQMTSNMAISLLLAFIFQPVKRFFDKVTNEVFYKDNYNTDDFFARLNKTLSFTTDLRGLFERVSYEIGDTLKAEQAFFFIYTNADGNYISAGTEKHSHLPRHDAVLLEEESKGKDVIISASSLNVNDPIRRMMISHKIELVLPLMQEGAVIGYLCLGEHLTSGYTNRDIKALNTLSDELIIAIQNALAVHEIRELNATLQQRITNATKELRSKNAILLHLDKIKDEFISMASHQLRTPLTSVKGYLSMVIEGDAGKITASQKQLLDQAFMSSENMVHLINDFLNVSRIQAGKFIIDKSPVDLSLLVEQEINSLRPNAEARGMKFEYNKPEKFPIIDLDDGKTRQVVMNFADNAIYYSHDNSTITISLSIEGKNAVFTVKDTGIGVPAKEREHLFSKFYRASNAKVQRPDGTGVGIFLAKRVISEQGGEIIFESVEGKGSTFGFRIPIK